MGVGCRTVGIGALGGRGANVGGGSGLGVVRMGERLYGVNAPYNSSPLPPVERFRPPLSFVKTLFFCSTVGI